MSISNEEYGYMTKRASPKSPVLLDSFKAFIVGGIICAIAEGLNQWLLFYGLGEKPSRTIAMIVIIVITALLTAIGIFDNIAKHAGAGTMVPISGFANSMVSPALEFKAEGHILGTAAQMFSIAGPVVVFGCSAATIYGLIIYFFGLY
ncbi:MAG: SpoVA/SpoVAEb family sporulation membrane protein [Clostridia bacterium]|nr:SpoVA/SpoVAEb family sporulation membrane protein [Clostridia bacterium]